MSPALPQFLVSVYLFYQHLGLLHRLHEFVTRGLLKHNFCPWLHVWVFWQLEPDYWVFHLQTCSSVLCVYFASWCNFCRATFPNIQLLKLFRCNVIWFILRQTLPSLSTWRRIISPDFCWGSCLIWTTSSQSPNTLKTDNCSKTFIVPTVDELTSFLTFLEQSISSGYEGVEGMS